MGLRVLLSVLLLTSSLTINNVFADFDADDIVRSTQSPHHAPSYQPVAAPALAPHHHHHHHHHRHHQKLASPPVSHSPTKAPVHAPVHVPAHAPVHAPVHVPVHVPVHAPVHAPAHAPVMPPSAAPAPFVLPPRKLVAIQGVVYCKACKYKGVDTLIGAKPLQGAEVLLACNNTKYTLKVKATTDKNGYFFIKPPKTLTTYGSHRCRVTLLTSPMATCDQPTNLHAGVKGSLLVPSKKPPLSNPDAHPPPYQVFTVGPFAFEPSSKTPCGGGN